MSEYDTGHKMGLKFVRAEKKHIREIYEMTRELAEEENQSSLFTASIQDFTKAFTCGSPIMMGFLCFAGDAVAGFYNYYYKFASYSGTRVIYIEDAYLKKPFRGVECTGEFFGHCINLGRLEKCSRVEMRVLKSFNMGYDLLESRGFNKIGKWDVFRYEVNL